MPTLSTETANMLFTIDVIAEIFLAIIVPAAVFVWYKFDSALWNHRAEKKNKKIRDEISKSIPEGTKSIFDD